MKTRQPIATMWTVKIRKSGPVTLTFDLRPRNSLGSERLSTARTAVKD